MPLAKASYVVLTGLRRSLTSPSHKSAEVTVRGILRLVLAAVDGSETRRNQRPFGLVEQGEDSLSTFSRRFGSVGVRDERRRGAFFAPEMEPSELLPSVRFLRGRPMGEVYSNTHGWRLW